MRYAGSICILIGICFFLTGSTPAQLAKNQSTASDPNAMSQALSKMNEKLAQAGVAENTIIKHQMMITSKIDPLDPEAVLSIKDKLGLSQEQIAKLEDIAYKSRQQSKSVLNAQQAQTIDELQSQPKTLMKMQENLMNTVMNTMKSHQKVGRPLDCNETAGHRDVCDVKDANSAGISKAVSKSH